MKNSKDGYKRITSRDRDALDCFWQLEAGHADQGYNAELAFSGKKLIHLEKRNGGPWRAKEVTFIESLTRWAASLELLHTVGNIGGGSELDGIAKWLRRIAKKGD